MSQTQIGEDVEDLQINDILVEDISIPTAPIFQEPKDTNLVELIKIEKKQEITKQKEVSFVGKIINFFKSLF